MKKLAIFLATSLTLVGCAYQSTASYERQDGETFTSPNSPDQPKITSASNWQVIANNEGKLLTERLQGKPVIVEQNRSSNFAATFHNLLTTGLVANGALVMSENKFNPGKVTYEVNVVSHDWGSKAPDLKMPLGATAYYLTQEGFGLIKGPLLALKDQFSKNLSTMTEVVITTKAVSDSQVIYSSSNVYYIEDSNGIEYHGTSSHLRPAYNAGAVKSISVVGGAK